MISKLGQALPRWLIPSSNLAGGSLLERLRSTSFALCGAVTAVGLGLLALIANQGWPGLLASAIPPIPREGVHGAQVVAGPSSPSGGSSKPGLRLRGPSPRPAAGGSGPSGSPPTSRQTFVVGPPGPNGPAAASPGGHGGVGAPAAGPVPEQPAPAVPQPAAAPAPAATPAPVSTPPAVVEQPTAEESSSGHGKAKGHEKHSVPAGGESPAPVKEKHSHGPPPASPGTDPVPPAVPEAPTPPASGKTKGSPPGKALGHGK